MFGLLKTVQFSTFKTDVNNASLKMERYNTKLLYPFWELPLINPCQDILEEVNGGHFERIIKQIIILEIIV